jgi:hypothetical protein
MSNNRLLTHGRRTHLGRDFKPFGIARECSGCGRQLVFDYRQMETVLTHHCSVCN